MPVSARRSDGEPGQRGEQARDVGQEDLAHRPLPERPHAAAPMANGMHRSCGGWRWSASGRAFGREWCHPAAGVPHWRDARPEHGATVTPRGPTVTMSALEIA